MFKIPDFSLSPCLCKQAGLDLVSVRKDLDPRTLVSGTHGEPSPFWHDRSLHCTLHRGHLNPGPAYPNQRHCQQVHFLKYLKNALSYGLQTFWKFQWPNFQHKNLFFNLLRPPLATIATSKIDACFTNTFRQFYCKSSPELDVLFAISLKSDLWAWYCPWWRPCDYFGFAHFFVLQGP